MANDSRPTNEQIRGSVVRIIAAFAKRDSAAIVGTEELASDLRIPDSSMPFLRNSLLGYMQHFNPEASLTVSELRKPKQTVNVIVVIAQQRI
jgi:hypothetical protein